MSKLFYRGSRIYYRLDGIHDKRFVVNVDRGEKRFFLNFCSADDFESWYVEVPAKERTMNEVVMSDVRKLIVDIDGEERASSLSMFDFERHVESRIHEVFAVLEIGVPKVVIYKMTDESGEVCHDKLSYHAVVSNFCFTAKTCMGLCMIIASGQAWDGCADTGIYKALQCVRMEGSTKHGEKRWKWTSSDVGFKCGLVSCLEDTQESDVVCTVRSLRSQAKPSQACDLYGVDMSQFKVCRPPNATYIQLRRTRPGYCPQCNRIHDRENAAIKFVMGKPTFVCWRSWK